MCASKEDLHHKRMQSEDMYLLLLFLTTLGVCQLLDSSFLNSRYELFKKQGEFGSVKSAVVEHVWLNDNSLKIPLIASGIFAVSLGIGVEINCQWGLSNVR